MSHRVFERGESSASGQAHPDGARHGAALARGAFFNAVAFLTSNLRGIFTFLVARLLGSAVLGVFGLAWAATDLVSKLATLGFDTSIITNVARHEAAGDRAASVELRHKSLVLSLAVSVAAAAAGFFLGPIAAARFGASSDLGRATGVMLLALPGVTLYRVSNAQSRGMSVMHHDIYSRGLTESLGTAAAFLIALALGARTLAPEIAAIAGTLASGVVAFVLARGLYARAPERPAIAPVAMGAFTRSSLPIAVYDLLNIAVMQIDLIMLGFFVGRVPGVTLATLGVYAAACDVAGGLRKINQTFTPIFMPVIAQQMHGGHLAEAQATYGYVARWMLAILLPVVAVFALAGGAIMRIYGPAFVAGGPWVAIVGAACALNAFVALGETILVVERPDLNLVNSSVALAATIGINLFLIPAFGPLGAAIGMLVPYAIQGGLRGAEISWIFKWRWPLGAVAKPWIATLVALPIPLLLRAATTALLPQLAAGALYLLLYFAVWRFIGLDPHDRDVLDHLFPSRRRATVAV